MEQLRQEKLEIDQQLRAIQGSSMGSMQNFPVSRRSDRPYSNENDSMNRSNRGGSRGRGRGRGGGRDGGGNRRFHPGNNIQHDHMDNNDQMTNINSTYTNINEQKKMNSRGGGGGGGRGRGGGGMGSNNSNSIGGGNNNGRERNGNGERSDIDRHNDRRPPRPSSASTSSTPK